MTKKRLIALLAAAAMLASSSAALAAEKDAPETAAAVVTEAVTEEAVPQAQEIPEAPAELADDDVNVTPSSAVASVGDMTYATLQEAVNAAVQASDEDTSVEVLLSDDITLAEENSLKIYSDYVSIILNLNGHTITSSTQKGNDAISLNGANITLEIKDGVIDSTGVDSYGLYAYQKCNNLNLTFNNVEIRATGYALGVQGLTSNSNVVLKNSKIKCDGLGIYWPPKSGNLIIDDTEVTGGTGVVVKGAFVEVKGNSVITGTGEKKEAEDYYTGATDPNESSLTETGDAIYLESGYNDRDIGINIFGGILKSDNSYSLQTFIKTGEEEKSSRKIDISGGVFESGIVIQPYGKLTITGGTFSTDVSGYVASGY